MAQTIFVYDRGPLAVKKNSQFDRELLTHLARVRDIKYQRKTEDMIWHGFGMEDMSST